MHNDNDEYKPFNYPDEEPYNRRNYVDDSVVSTGTWILIFIITGIIGIIPIAGPIIVLIGYIICAFSPINLNLRNYARAVLILALIGVIIIFLLGGAYALTRLSISIV